MRREVDLGICGYRGRKGHTPASATLDTVVRPGEGRVQGMTQQALQYVCWLVERTTVALMSNL